MSLPLDSMQWLELFDLISGRWFGRFQVNIKWEIEWALWNPGLAMSSTYFHQALAL